MKKKYFVSCALPWKKLGAIQLECKKSKLVKKSQFLCPRRAHFRAYEVKEFDPNMPIGEFVNYDKMKELGY